MQECSVTDSTGDLPAHYCDRIISVPALGFAEARDCVIDTVRTGRTLPTREEASLSEAMGRVLAEDIAADRDYPALARSVRDGYARCARSICRPPSR